jgi:tRNA G37 N-methylase Trm5
MAAYGPRRDFCFDLADQSPKLIEQNLAILDKCKKKKTRKVSHIVGDLRELCKKRKKKGYSLPSYYHHF